jgi:hypothetical protein
MNTFAVLLLAYPFYLAVNNRLIAYTSLVQKAPAQSVGGAAVSQAVSSVPTIPVG